MDSGLQDRPAPIGRCRRSAPNPKRRQQSGESIGFTFDDAISVGFALGDPATVTYAIATGCHKRYFHRVRRS